MLAIYAAGTFAGTLGLAANQDVGLIAATGVYAVFAVLSTTLSTRTQRNIDLAVALAYTQGIEKGRTETVKALANRMHHEPTTPMNGDDW